MTSDFEPTLVHPIEGSELLGAVANALYDRLDAEVPLQQIREWLEKDTDGVWTHHLGPLLDILEAAFGEEEGQA